MPPVYRGYVYVVKAPNDLYKIGTATNIERRIRKLNFPVELIHGIKANHSPQAEAFLQHCYGHRRVGGEWFRLTDEDLEEIKAIAFIPIENEKPSQCINVKDVPIQDVSSIDEQAARYGYRSRQAFLVDVFGFMAKNQDVQKAIKNAIETLRQKQLRTLSERQGVDHHQSRD
jgi:hypothetical protein